MDWEMTVWIVLAASLGLAAGLVIGVCVLAYRPPDSPPARDAPSPVVSSGSPRHGVAVSGG